MITTHNIWVVFSALLAFEQDVNIYIYIKYSDNTFYSLLSLHLK